MAKQVQFVNLHRHDAYSMFDGVDLATRAADRAIKLGQPAVGLTNHGTVFGIIEHYRICNEKGIKPILGMEAYVTVGAQRPESTEQREARKVAGGEALKLEKSAHQTLIVQNYAGYRNLMKLVTLSYDYFYYKPRVPLKYLGERGDGLIVLSGCPSSLLQRLLSADKVEQAEKLFAWYVKHFGDRFYAEVQHSALTQKTMPMLLALAKKYGVPLAATNDAHYVDPEDRVVHDMLLKLRRKDQGEENPTYGDGYHMVSAAEMASYLYLMHRETMTKKQIGEAIENTVRIAERCDPKLEDHKPERMLPAFWGDNPGALVQKLADDGLVAKGLDTKRAYLDRLAEEMRVIRKLGYEEYFLVCHEVTSWARGQGIMIGPRGSVCGSLLAYVLGITQVDPIVHGTLFERFLHDQKKSFPDVDLDIDSRYKTVVHDWFYKRFAPYVLPIITFGRYGSGNIANDLRKAFPEIITLDRKNKIRFAIERIKHEHVFVIDYEVLDQYAIFDAIEADLPGIKRIVLKLYNMARYIGKHPGGVCFVPGEYDRWLPKIKIRGQTMSSYNFFDVEYMGLLKFDLLGLTSISAISQTLTLIKQRHDINLTVEQIPLDNGKCYREFSEGNTDGIFQFETRGARAILMQIEPDNFGELAASTALNRPGVSNNLDKYVEGKRARKTGGFFGETYGAPVYQEQLAAFLRHLGFPWVKVDKFLKALKINVKTYAITAEKEAGTDIFAEIIARLVELGKDKAKSEAMLERIKQYSFNKAHAVGYALVAYWLMWLRVHYPMEFWCSVLTMENDDQKRAAYEGSCLFDGAVLLPPSVNGTADYAIEGNAIRVGTRTIKNVGEKAALAIQAGRPYHRPQDIRKLSKRTVNARVIKALVHGGALYLNDDQYRAWAVKYNVERHEMNKGILLKGGKASVG